MKDRNPLKPLSAVEKREQANLKENVLNPNRKTPTAVDRVSRESLESTCYELLCIWGKVALGQGDKTKAMLRGWSTQKLIDEISNLKKTS